MPSTFCPHPPLPGRSAHPHPVLSQLLRLLPFFAGFGEFSESEAIGVVFAGEGGEGSFNDFFHVVTDSSTMVQNGLKLGHLITHFPTISGASEQCELTNG